MATIPSRLQVRCKPPDPEKLVARVIFRQTEEHNLLDGSHAAEHFILSVRYRMKLVIMISGTLLCRLFYDTEQSPHLLLYDPEALLGLLLYDPEAFLCLLLYGFEASPCMLQYDPEALLCLLLYDTEALLCLLLYDTEALLCLLL
ncbi:hypothetical protein NDU88_005623 [Pleurodeles waltl]|uniref:Uncharacterized protein n=1 Tax=Pleurodeles waltl TaxID=8319 RepID=A0AAV7WCC3_PLEWA|nr:hypothetical protein NDU88_005623 [Pleurodeles waltl]